MTNDEKCIGAANGSVKTDRRTSSTDTHAADARAADAKAAFESMAKQLAEMREWIARYFSARADALGVRLRFAAVRALFAVGVALGLSSAIATAAVIMVVGLADGLTVLCGDRPWAGELAAGALVLGTTCATVWLGSGSWHRASFDKLRDKYAHRHEEQRKGHPRDVGQRAAENAPPA